MNSFRIVIGVTNAKDIYVLPLFLDYLETKRKVKNISVMVFCQNMRLKRLVSNINDKRINNIISDSELHYISINNKTNISIKNKIPDETLKFLASSDRSISYKYFPLTKVIKKVLTDQDYKKHYQYVSTKFCLTIKKLNDFNPHYGLAFTRDNGPVMYNYLFFALKKIKVKMFFQHWLRIEGIITINDTIFEKDIQTEDIYHNIFNMKMNYTQRVIEYHKKYLTSNRKVIEEYYGEIINEEKKLFKKFIKTIFQFWRLKYIILQFTYLLLFINIFIICTLLN